MPHPFDTLTIENGAKIIFTPCPGTKEENLESSVTTLANEQTQAIVSVMHNDELARLGATALPVLCQSKNIAWYQLPIIDDEGPEDAFFAAWHKHKDELLQRLRDKQTIAVHCKGGSGRTGLVIALLLVEFGYSKKEAKNLVQSIRPLALTKDKQLTFFGHY